MVAPSPRSIAQIAVVVEDLERAKGFYSDVLGLPWIADAPPSLSFFQCGETRLMLSPSEGPDTRGNSILYYSVEDIRAAHDSMVRHGVSFEAEPHMVGKLGDKEVWLAIFRDSEGNLAGLMS
jgi:methylmalonyl-CoA/ethylmalonyl-CoA epimerase